MVNHSNNTDSVLVLVMAAAASLTIHAVGKGRLRGFVLACAVAGTANHYRKRPDHGCAARKRLTSLRAKGVLVTCGGQGQPSIYIGSDS